MGLFSKASIVMTPNGVKAGKVYSIKPSNGDGDFTFSRSTVANKEASDDLITEVAANVPRLDYSDGTCPSILLEPQSTNLITYPLSFDNAYWAKSGVTVVGGQTAPSTDNPTGAFKLTFASDNYMYATVSSGAADTSSIYIKGTAGETIKFGKAGNVGGGSFFTLSGDWQRLEFYNSNAALNVVLLSTLSGATARVVYVFGAQVEALPYPTSLMLPATEGSTVTRTADLCTNSGTVNDFNSVEGVLYVEASLLHDDNSNKYIGIADASGNNAVQLDLDYSNSRLQFVVRSGGVVQVNIKLPYLGTSTDKFALKWILGNFSIFLNGNLIGTQTSGVTPIGLSNLNFNSSTGSGPFYGKVKDLRVYKKALTDAELITLTTL